MEILLCKKISIHTIFSLIEGAHTNNLVFSQLGSKIILSTYLKISFILLSSYLKNFSYVGLST